ncbi:MAG: CDP-alcohol phosphatidyltransferase family protein [Sulfuritalea sp.]|nr:CDP-alcohol phosphatidyltransferase family protein [Sulfuritalea sp.]
MRTDILTLPNLITFARLGLLPILLWALAVREYGMAFALFVAASVGDGLDGFLARKLNQRSRLGALLDPIADKLTILGIAWVLATQGILPVWIAALMTLRDLIIVAGALAYRQLVGSIEMAPTRLSKLNTVLEFLLLALALMLANRWIPAEPWLGPYLLVVACTVVASGTQYVWVWGRRAKAHHDAHRH